MGLGTALQDSLLIALVSYQGVPVTGCGFFKHPDDAKYGASPDGLTESFAVEVKTRAEHFDTPGQRASQSCIAMFFKNGGGIRNF